MKMTSSAAVVPSSFSPAFPYFFQEAEPTESRPFHERKIFFNLFTLFLFWQNPELHITGKQFVNLIYWWLFNPSRSLSNLNPPSPTIWKSLTFKKRKMRMKKSKSQPWEPWEWITQEKSFSHMWELLKWKKRALSYMLFKLKFYVIYDAKQLVIFHLRYRIALFNVCLTGIPILQRIMINKNHSNNTAIIERFIH